MRSAALLIGILVCAAATAAQDEPSSKTPARRVELVPHHGAALPLDARFADEFGRDRALRDFFDGKRPVLLTLNYFRCPLLCGKQLNALVDGGDGPKYEGVPGGLKSLAAIPGDGYCVLTVSFDPLETADLAARKKKSYVVDFGDPRVADGWHFLTGKSPAIDALTQAAGFHYAWIDDQYSHPAAVIACTPDGRISDYATGYNYDRALLERLIDRARRGAVTPPPVADPAPLPWAPIWIVALALGAATFLATWWLIHRFRHG